MNQINLRGKITNITSSHEIQGVEFNRATLVVPSKNGKDDLVDIRFKRFSNPYKDGDEVSLRGNLRSYSTSLPSGKTKVDLYVFTYFDAATTEDINKGCIEGRICKIEELRNSTKGSKNLHFILANNMIVSNGSKKLNSYIPCIAWNDLAEKLSDCTVNTKLRLTGRLHSRTYTKVIEGISKEHLVHEFVIEDAIIL